MYSCEEHSPNGDPCISIEENHDVHLSATSDPTLVKLWGYHQGPYRTGDFIQISTVEREHAKGRI